jgi:pectate lyase
MSIKRIFSASFLSGLAFAAGATITVTGTRDFGGATVGTSCNGNSESQQPVILVKDGGVVKNVTLAAGAAADGIHCEGNCTLQNVTWADVCEDAATMKGGSGKKMTVTGGSAKNANDKIFQHNGIGSNVTISGFTVNGSNGKLWRSCGNCTSQGKRTVNMSNITVNGTLSSGLAGVNSNYGDVATIRSVRWKGYVDGRNEVCVAYKGILKSQGGDAPKLGPQWNTTSCNVSHSDITSF